MKSETSFKVFFLKEHRKNSLKYIVFPRESVFTAIAKIPQGHRTAHTAHYALMMEVFFTFINFSKMCQVDFQVVPSGFPSCAKWIS